MPPVMGREGGQNGEPCLSIIFSTVNSKFLSTKLLFSTFDEHEPIVIVLSSPSRLRRVYILFNAKHGINSFDSSMLRTLNEQCQAFSAAKFTLQAVITKADAVPVEQVATVIPKMRQQIFEAAPFCLPPIITSATMQPRFGIDEMRKSIVEASGIGRIDPG